MPFPAPKSLSGKSENDVIEIRNHLLSTHLIGYSVGLEHEIDLGDIKNINHIILRDTPMEKFELENNEIQHAGEFRKVEVMAGNVHETVYPVSSRIILLKFFLSRFLFYILFSFHKKFMH